MPYFSKAGRSRRHTTGTQNTRKPHSYVQVYTFRNRYKSRQKGREMPQHVYRLPGGSYSRQPQRKTCPLSCQQQLTLCCNKGGLKKKHEYRRPIADHATSRSPCLLDVFFFFSPSYYWPTKKQAANSIQTPRTYIPGVQQGLKVFSQPLRVPPKRQSAWPPSPYHRRYYQRRSTSIALSASLRQSRNFDRTNAVATNRSFDPPASCIHLLDISSFRGGPRCPWCGRSYWESPSSA